MNRAHPAPAVGALLLGAALVAVGCASAPDTPQPLPDPSLLDLEVTSWAEVDPGDLNSWLDEAAGAGLDWTSSASRTVLTSLGGDQELVLIELVSEGNRGERPDTVFVQVARDRFMDDSVRGDRHEAVMYRLDDGTWRFRSLRRAFRCWRGEFLDTYSASPCP